MRIAISSAWRGRGPASALLVELERRLIAARVSRFDYLIPIGTPDTAARSAIWSRYTDGRADVDVAALVAASELFTPADIEHAARVAAQASFERDLEAIGVGAGAHGRLGASTDDYLAALAQCRPTVTPAMIDEFSADITAHARC
ncbi:hypothetical protein [Streptomyces lydicus]|nr:hypothetical protein [Streptomyces lydicus]